MSSKLTGSRLLRKQIPYFSAYPLAGDVDWAIQTEGGNWRIVVNDLGMNYAVWNGFFDLGGYSSEELTTFVSGAGWQESEEWIAGTPANFARPRIKTWDIISKSPINDVSLDRHGPGTASSMWFAPGFAGSNYDLEEIFAARYRHFDYSTTITAGFNNTYEQVWGAGDATAGDRIFITRIVQLTGIANYGLELLIVPPQDVIAPITLGEEKELQYIERLRRSYVLAESRDL